jgi:DNA repair exonuclease SbcCD ATPase subunit
MRYTALILKGFRRFALNQVSHFEIRPTEQIQLILGTNGSGKSSLLQELTPLPANPADYLKDGSKEIHIVDRGNTYILKSDFALKQAHSFMCNAEELNPGGTASVQRELVRQHFWVTPELHDLETGFINFTDMGPGTRREWFTQLSDVNYDYAIGVFEKLSDECRAVSNSVKLDKKRLVDEQTKIITEDEQKVLHAEVKTLHEELSRLFEMRAPIKRPLMEVQAERNRMEAQLKDISTQLLNLKVESPAHLYRDDWGQLQHLVFNSIDDVNLYIDDIRDQITAQEAVLAKMVQEHGKLKETVDILKKQGADGIESVRRRIASIADIRLGFLKERRLKLELAGIDPTQSAKTIESIRQDLAALLFELPANANRQYSSQVLQEMKTRHQAYQEAFRMHSTAAAGLAAKVQHAEEHRASGSITCPKCDHKFHRGLSDAEFEELKRRQKSHAELAEGLEQRIKSHALEVAEQENYGNLYRQVVQLTRSTPTLKPFWDHVVEKELFINSPKAVMGVLQVFEHDVACEMKAQVVDDEIEELKKLLAQSEQLGDQNINDAMEKLNTATLEIEGLTKALTRARSELNDFYAYRKQLETAISLERRVHEYIERFDMLTHEVVETLRLQTIQQCIQHTQSALARKEESLNQMRQQQAVIENLKQTIARRSKEEIALKAVVKALSPKDGLIAEGLLGFIKHYTHEMNQLIRKIWVYRLEVQACGSANENGAQLDYKFPMVVGSRENVVQDISRGSSGMQEIINLAFKVVALKYSHLENGALLLDEFGRTFDAEHRNAAIMAIKMLMETKPFTQLFMISHYESHYGAFTNVEVCVLDARNIATPKVYNQHVLMQ